MPRKRRQPGYNLHKPSGQARVRIDGRDHYLGEYDSPESHKKYAEIIARWWESGSVNPEPPAEPVTPVEPLTVAELLLAYLRHAESYYRRPDGTPTGEARMIRDAMSCLKDLYASLPVCQFSPKRLKAVREAMIAKGWTRRHVNKQVGRVRRIFKWGVSEELVPPSVFHGLQTVEPLRKGRSEARETKPVRPVPDDVVDATLPYLSPVVRAMVQVQRFSACRPGEVCRMKGAEIDRSGDVWL